MMLVVKCRTEAVLRICLLQIFFAIVEPANDFRNLRQLQPSVVQSGKSDDLDFSIGNATPQPQAFAAAVRVWLELSEDRPQPLPLQKIIANFSQFGKTFAAYGYGVTIHPYTVCLKKSAAQSGNFKDRTLKDSVVIIMQDEVHPFVSGCVCPLHQIQFAQNSGAAAVILTGSVDPKKLAACETELNADITSLGSDAGIRIPVININGVDRTRLINMTIQSAGLGVKMAVRIEPELIPNEKILSDEKLLSNFRISEFNVGVIVASGIFMCGICSIVFLKLKWRARHRALSLDLAKQALADMETRKFRKPVVRRAVEDAAANMFGFGGRKSTSKLLSSAKRNFSSKPEKLPCDLTGSKFSIASSAHEQCVVCLEEYRDGVELRVLPCGHEFHKLCVDPWLLTGRTCPLCQFDVVLRRYPGEDSKNPESGLLNSSNCVLTLDSQSMAALRAELTLPLLLEEVPTENAPEGRGTPTIPIEFLSRNMEFNTPSRLHRYCADPLCRRQRDVQNRRGSRMKKPSSSATRSQLGHPSSPSQPCTSNHEAALPAADHSTALRSPLSDNFTSNPVVIHQPNPAISSPANEEALGPLPPPLAEPSLGPSSPPAVPNERTIAELSTTSAASVIACPHSTRSRSKNRKHSASSKQRKKRPQDSKGLIKSSGHQMAASPPTRQEIIAAYRRHMEFISKYPSIPNKMDGIPTVSMALPKELKTDAGYLSDVSAQDHVNPSRRRPQACRRGSIEQNRLLDSAASRNCHTQFESPVHIPCSFSASSVQQYEDPVSTDDSSDFFLPAAPFVRFFEQEKEKNRLKPSRNQETKPSVAKKPIPIRQPQTALCESPISPAKDPSDVVRFSTTVVRDNSLVSPTKAFSAASRSSEII